MKDLVFVNEDEEVRSRIIEAAFWLRGETKKFLDKFGLTQQQYRVLRIIQSNTRELPLTTKEISDQMIDRHADTSRVVDRLIKKGLLMKKICSDDKRLVRISLAPKATSLFTVLDSKVHELDAITQKLDHNEKDMLIYILAKLVG